MLTRIAFERHGDTIPGLSKGIYTINPDGNDCRQIRANGMYPKWSPNGQWIAFREDTEDNEWLASVFIMKPDGQQVRRVTFHQDISVDALHWSPDSKWLAYSLWLWQDKRHQICVINLESGQFHQITNGTDSNAYPVWTPNNEIVFSKTIDPQESRRLFIMNPDGQNQRVCNLFIAGDYDPIWTYDGKKIVFQRGDKYYVMNSDGSGLQTIPTHGRVPQVIISPDGRYVAYSSTDDIGEAGFEIFVMNLDGTEKRKIVSNPRSKNKEVSSQDISWSPVLQLNQPQTMKYYLYKNNQQYGPYEESAILEWLRNGRCSPNDPAIREGMTEWQPLGTLIAFDGNKPMPAVGQSFSPLTPENMSRNKQASSHYENEVALLDRYEDEVNTSIEQFLDSDPDQRSRIQKQLERTLEIYGRQIQSFRTAFPTEDYEWKSHLSVFYVAQATVKAFSVGFFRKSSGRSGNLAMGIATGLIAKQQEKNNAMQALQLLDQALSLQDSAHPRMLKAQVFRALNQNNYALNELNYIIANFQDSSAYLDARRMKDEIENPAKSGPCFIATAAYDSPLAPEVFIFRRFRDEVLLKSRLGKVFIEIYYFISPPFALIISKIGFLKRLVRSMMLSPLLKLLKKHFRF